jgi:predicted nuclease of predicted toxin-antitoxin system
VKFLLDHDVPAEIAHLLRYWEHNVTLLRTVLPVTASDEEVFGHACSEGLILISCNRDHFLTLARQIRDHPGSWAFYPGYWLFYVPSNVVAVSRQRL